MATVSAGLAALWTTTWVVNRSLRRVTGPSMLPLLQPGDLLLTLPVGVRPPRRGDVVVVEVAGVTSVKRLVGLPGDDVVLLDGHLHVDGSWWDLPGVVLVDEDRRWRLGDGEVVVLGDNREASTDSRAVGPVEVGAVERVVVGSLRPPRSLGVGMRRLEGPRPRPAVRVVTLDPDDRVLLMRVRDVDGIVADWWETPGGGLQPGEDVIAAAHRELAEEVGADNGVVKIKALGHEATRQSTLFGTRLHRVETSVAARLSGGHVDETGWTPSERRDVVEWRWFTPDEVAALDAVVVPADLATLVEQARAVV